MTTKSKVATTIPGVCVGGGGGGRQGGPWEPSLRCRLKQHLPPACSTFFSSLACPLRCLCGKKSWETRVQVALPSSEAVTLHLAWVCNPWAASVQLQGVPAAGLAAAWASGFHEAPAVSLMGSRA